MNPLNLDRKANEHFSFKIWKNSSPYIHNLWHFHKEFEITLIEKGSGTRYVGDSIQKFENNDLVLLGSDLPHEWRTDKDVNVGNDFNSSSLAIHFNTDFPGFQIFSLPEAKSINLLLETAKLGIRVTHLPTVKKIRLKIISLLRRTDFRRIIGFAEILYLISTSPGNQILSGNGFVELFLHSKSDRIDRVYKYVMRNFRNKISLNEVASLVNLTPNSFCRYFKTYTGKTFIDYLNEIRTGYACKLLVKSNLSVSLIASECGYNNMAHFNKQFKMIAGCTPVHYARKFRTD